MKFNWQDKTVVRELINDKILQSCLFHTGSLTKFLKSKCKGKLYVEVKSESWQKQILEEEYLLKTDKNERVFVRESWLKSDDKQLVYARTLISEKILVDKYARLKNLGDQPLGEVLFNDKSIFRSNLLYAKVPYNHPLYQQNLDENQMNNELWARQSLFYIINNPLLLTEFFLPDLKLCIQN